MINPLTILPLALKDLGGSVQQAGFMVALLWGGMSLPQLFSAFYFSPKWSDPKYVAVMHAPALICIGALSCLFYFFPDMDPSLKLNLFLALSAGFFVLVGFVVPHWINMISRIVPEQTRGRYFAWSFSMASVFGIASGVLAARWCEQGGLRWGYAACFGLALPIQIVSMALLFIMKTNEGRAHPAGALVPFLKRQWEHIAGNREVAIFLGVFILMQVSAGSGGLYTMCLKDRGVSTAWFETYNAALSLGSLLGAFILGHMADKSGPRHGLSLAFLVLAVSIPFLLIPMAPVWAAGGFFGNGFFNSAFPVLSLYLVMRLAQPGHTTQFSGAINTLTTPIVILAPLMHGRIAGTTSYAVSFSISIAGCLLGLLAIRLMPGFGTASTASPSGTP